MVNLKGFWQLETFTGVYGNGPGVARCICTFEKFRFNYDMGLLVGTSFI